MALQGRIIDFEKREKKKKKRHTTTYHAERESVYFGLTGNSMLYLTYLHSLLCWIGHGVHEDNKVQATQDNFLINCVKTPTNTNTQTHTPCT